jgi:hypothetical protein
MGLFSRKPAVIAASSELKYNISEIHKDMEKLRARIYDTRDGEGHKVFLKFVEKLRNLELLQMASTKEMTSSSHAYHRGRIEALSSVLAMRDVCISDMKEIRAKDKNSRAEKSTVRNYINPARTSQAQPSI